MKINGYKKNKYYYHNSHNNIYSPNNTSFCHKNPSPLNCLFEVENFLCNLKKFSKCLNLYKFFK